MTASPEIRTRARKVAPPRLLPGFAAGRMRDTRRVPVERCGPPSCHLSMAQAPELGCQSAPGSPGRQERTSPSHSFWDFTACSLLLGRLLLTHGRPRPLSQKPVRPP